MATRTERTVRLAFIVAGLFVFGLLVLYESEKTREGGPMIVRCRSFCCFDDAVLTAGIVDRRVGLGPYLYS
jgi:hypothetical protein